MDIYKFLGIDKADVDEILLNKNRYYISYPIKKRNKKRNVCWEYDSIWGLCRV